MDLNRFEEPAMHEAPDFATVPQYSMLVKFNKECSPDTLLVHHIRWDQLKVTYGFENGKFVAQPSNCQSKRPVLDQYKD